MSYAPRPALVAALAAAAVVLGLLAVGLDNAGRLLVGLAALLFAAEATRCAVVRPTLTVDAEGLTYGRAFHAWHDVVRIGRLDGDRPRRRANVLEIDLGDRLLHVPAYRLGDSVERVVAAIEASRQGYPRG